MAAQEIGSLYLGLGFDTAVFDRQIVQIPARVNQATESIKKGFQAAGTHVDKFQVSVGSTRAAVQNLSFQLNDIGTSLASGGSPFRVLAQQGGQIIQVFQQGGGVSNVMGGFATMLRGLVTPATVAVGAVAAVGLSIGVLTARALENQNAMRQFSVMLKGLGLEGQATAAGLEESAKQLKDVGLNASEARAAIAAATRAGIAPGQAARVVRTGQNLIPALGEGAPQQLISAIAGGVEPLGKLALQLGLVTAREVEAAREAAKFGMELSFLDRWIGLIEQHSKGLNQAALSPMGQAMRRLSIAFNELLDSMSKSRLILGIVDAMTKLADVLKSLFELQPPTWFRVIVMGETTRKPGDVAYDDIPSAGGGGSAADPRNKTAMIRYWASYFGHDPDTAVKVAGSEGLGTYAGDKGTSFGAFQLHVGGGLGDEYRRETGRDPSNPANEDDMIRWSMQNLGRTGYGPYHGAARIGVGARTGVGAGGSFYARPEMSRETFRAGAAQSFENEFAQTQVEINAERIRAGLLPGFGGPGGLTRAGFAAQAATEARGRFGFANDISNDPMAQEQIGRRLRQLTELGQARGRTSLAQGGEQDRQQTEILQKQASLFGQSTQEIERQVALLKIRQQAEQAGLAVTDEAVKAREEEAKALADANDLLKRQQTLMSQMREVAGVFENAFSSAFDAIADGTFNARKAIGGLLRDLAKTLASQAFKRLLGTGDEGGGLLGTIAGKLFPSLLGGNISNNFGETNFGGGGDIPAFAGGGSFAVGGSGSIDSQLVAFRATPGEMVQISPANSNYSSGRGEVIHINLNPSEGWVSGIADQRIVTRSGQIIDVAVKQSQRTVQRNFAGMSAEAQARTA